MIVSIHISNYAIIDQIELSLQEGLTVITGETGAGKSILLGALGLVLGNRADSQVLYNKDSKCIVEVEFDLRKHQLQPLFEEADLDYDDRCIIRREINVQGKSRAFINDTPATLSTLRKIAGNLVDLHQQFDTLEINQETFQIDVLDALADHQEITNEYKKIFNSYLHNRQQLSKIKLAADEAAKEKDFIQFQAQELSNLDLQAGEYVELENEFQRIQNSEEIKLVSQQVSDKLDGGEYSIHGTLTDLYRELEKLRDFDPQASSIADRIHALREEVSDLAHEAIDLQEGADYDEERLAFLEERINEINRLMIKHRLQTDQELIQMHQEFEEKLDSYANLDNEISRIEKEVDKQSKKLDKLATQITSSRKKSALKLEAEVKHKLEQLSMPNAILKVAIKESESFRKSGKDLIEFLFTANKGGELLPLQKVASGGELSRLNLSIKSIIAGAITLPSLIFDEIDTGVSGNVSLRMGKLIKSLAAKHQTIVITHSPQIAALADHHFFIFKSDEGARTITGMKILDTIEKRVEIAKMLSGDPPTEAALKNAEDLLAFKE